MTEVTVLKATMETDPFSGQETHESWATPASTVVTNCIIEPLQSNEPVEAGRASVNIGYKIHMPYGTDVTERDRVVLYGHTYNVDGRPFAWKNPFTGREAMIEVQVTTVVG